MLLKNKELSDLPKYYELMYLDFVENYVTNTYFAKIHNKNIFQIKHILDAGSMIVFKKAQLN